MSDTRIVAALAAGLLPFLPCPAAQAQTQAVPFEGPYAGPYVGALEHHFFIETIPSGTGGIDTVQGGAEGRYSRDWQIGGGAMAGYDLAIANRLRVGVEGSLQVGGGSPEAFLDAGRYAQNARFGYRATAKAGLVPTDRLMIFVKGGYGGDRYSIDNEAGVIGATDWSSSFVVGAGAQVRFGRNIELRLEYEHLDTSSYAFFVGLPIRF